MLQQNTKKEGLTIIRKFKAPKNLVFEAFSKEEAFAQWWGPVGMRIEVKSFDFKKGGQVHYSLEGNGQVMWGLFKFGTISKPDLIEFVSSFSNEEGKICASPFPMDFPMEIFNQITLMEENGFTTLTLQGHPINATPEQEATYYSITQSMQEGFGGTFDQLEAYLSKTQG